MSLVIIWTHFLIPKRQCLAFFHWEATLGAALQRHHVLEILFLALETVFPNNLRFCSPSTRLDALYKQQMPVTVCIRTKLDSFCIRLLPFLNEVFSSWRGSNEQRLGSWSPSQECRFSAPRTAPQGRPQGCSVLNWWLCWLVGMHISSPWEGCAVLPLGQQEPQAYLGVTAILISISSIHHLQSFINYLLIYLSNLYCCWAHQRGSGCPFSWSHSHAHSR